MAYEVQSLAENLRLNGEFVRRLSAVSLLEGCLPGRLSGPDCAGLQSVLQCAAQKAESKTQAVGVYGCSIQRKFIVSATNGPEQGKVL